MKPGVAATLGWCKFCGQICDVTFGDQFKCADCNTKYYIVQRQCAIMIFYINDPDKQIFSLVQDFQNKITTINMDESCPPLKYTIPNLFPDINPQNALQMARRLKNLVAFS